MCGTLAFARARARVQAGNPIKKVKRANTVPDGPHVLAKRHGIRPPSVRPDRFASLVSFPSSSYLSASRSILLLV